jgi:hypothetical protein
VEIEPPDLQVAPLVRLLRCAPHPNGPAHPPGESVTNALCKVPYNNGDTFEFESRLAGSGAVGVDLLKKRALVGLKFGYPCVHIKLAHP